MKGPDTMLPLRLSDEVAHARAQGSAIVALESTIITHGMPWPDNLDMARTVEADIRAAGAVPATVAVIDGTLHVGLEDAQLAALAQLDGAAKLSRADLAVALAQGATGATTVAATMICARAAGIAVFATGGIGGVHRGAEASFDISADLQELARSPVTVVAAGAKAILDLPKTLEVLETLGVPVIAHGQDAFPAFWARDSGLTAPLRLDDPAAIARAHRMRTALGLAGGQLVANPVPQDAAIARATVEGWIDQALADCADASAKDVTPRLLARINTLSGGASLRANIALVRGNARLGAAIARALACAQDGAQTRDAQLRDARS